MTTKTRSRFIMLGLMILTVVACSKKSTDYTQVIPPDATAVMALDLETLGNKAGDDKDNSLKLKIMDALKSGLKAETLLHLEKMLKDPAESGITLKDRLFMFTAPAYKYPAVVFKVENEEKLRKTFELLINEQIAQPITDGNDFSYTVLNNNTVCAFNSSALIITLKADGTEEQLGALLRGDGLKDKPKNEKFAQMLKRKGDMLFYTAYNAIPPAYTRQIGASIPDSIKLSDLSLIGDMRFEKGQLTLEFDLFSNSEKIKALIGKQEQVMGKIKGDLLNNFPASTLALLSLNIDGKQLYSFLQENEDFRNKSSLSKAEKVKELFYSFKGDVSVGLINVTMSSMPTFVAYAEADKTVNINSIYESKAELGLGRNEDILKLGDNEYVYKSRAGNFFFGYKNNFLYLTNDELLYKNAGAQNAQSLKGASYAANIKGKRQYMVVDVENILQLPVVKMLVGFGGRQMSTYYDAASRISFLEITGEDGGKCTINLMLKDKESNAMKQIVDLGKTFAGL